MNVLIIDDDPLIRHAYSHYLSRKKYTVYQAENGMVGLELLNLHPEIVKVVLDAYMPEMDAFRFLKHIQDDSLYKTQHPDIYFITAWDESHILSRLFAEQIDQTNIKIIFKKPLDLEVLHNTLQAG